MKSINRSIFLLSTVWFWTLFLASLYAITINSQLWITQGGAVLVSLIPAGTFWILLLVQRKNKKYIQQTAKYFLAIPITSILSWILLPIFILKQNDPNSTVFLIFSFMAVYLIQLIYAAMVAMDFFKNVQLQS